MQIDTAIRTEISEKKEMLFKNRTRNIQAAGYNGKHTVGNILIYYILSIYNFASRIGYAFLPEYSSS